MEFLSRAIVTLTIFASLAVQIPGLPTDTSSECHSSGDCGPGECCVLGMMRFSMPQCLPLGQLEDYCREDNDPKNETLYYPSGLAVEVIDVYTHVCPCDTGMLCTDNTCVQSDAYDNNYIY